LIGKFSEFTGDLGEQFDELFTILDEKVDLTASNITIKFTDLFSAISGELIIFKDLFVGEWGVMEADSLVAISNMTRNILGALITDEDSFFNNLTSAFGGEEGQDSLGEALGKSVVQGIADGILNEVTFDTVLKPAISTFAQRVFDAFVEEFEIVNPSIRAAREVGVPIIEGVAAGIESGTGTMATVMQGVAIRALNASLTPTFGASAGLSGSTNISNINRTNNFNLNVSSSQNSQGLISDFGILQVMATDE
jgi:hypothetical protein